MKKFVLLVLLALVAAPPVAWKVQKNRMANITVLDASVFDEQRTHHAGLIWMMEHMRIRTSRGTAYGLDDYFGYFPFSSDKVRRLERDSLDDTDLLYITDAGGVWSSDMERFGVLRDVERDVIVHTGFSTREINTIIDYINAGGLAIGEALLFYAEHEGGMRYRNLLEEAFGVEWTGWIGGWFKDLNSIRELPFWVRTLYKRSTGQRWSYQGPGVIFIRPGSGDFIVLTPGIELREPRPEIVISRRVGPLAERVESGVPLWGWFEVVDAGVVGDVQAVIRLQLTGVGESALADKGLVASFPAIVSQRIGKNTYYLATDMSKVPTWLGPAQVKWMPEIRGRLAKLLEKQISGEHHFWRFYMPFLRNILDELAR